MRLDASGRFRFDRTESGYRVTDTKADRSEAYLFALAVPPYAEARTLADAELMAQEYLRAGRWELPRWRQTMDVATEQVDDYRFPAGYRRSRISKDVRRRVALEREAERVLRQFRRLFDRINTGIRYR